MDDVLVVGGTRFIGRHVVDDLLENGYDVTLFNRGNHENPFAADDRVDHVEGDRTEEGELRLAAERVDPDLVVDMVAYHPRDVRVATDVFADVDAYVYVSSGSAYGVEEVPKREGETPLHDCTAEQATDDSMSSYGPRKAEGDRAVFAAAEDGVNAYSVRPCIVYGPHDYTERLNYWIERVRAYDRVVVPGDGTNLWHRVYVGSVASAIRVVAESGTPGESYNVGDHRLLTLDDTVELVADVLDTDVEVVHASDRELQIGGLSADDFVLYRDTPHVFDTNRLESLGWDPVDVETAMERTVESHVENGVTADDHDPGREAEERVMDVLDTV